jgi:hypothetical protein
MTDDVYDDTNLPKVAILIVDIYIFILPTLISPVTSNHCGVQHGHAEG